MVDFGCMEIGLRKRAYGADVHGGALVVLRTVFGFHGEFFVHGFAPCLTLFADVPQAERQLGEVCKTSAQPEG